MRSALGLATAIAVAAIGLGTTGAPAGARTAAVTPRPVTAWVTSQGDGTITPIDTTTMTAGTPINLSTGANTPYQIAAMPDGSAVYVTMFGDNSVRRVDTATREAGPPILLGDDRGGNPISIAITPNGKTVYVSDYSYTGDGVVWPIDTATDTVGAPIEPHAELGAMAITPNGRTVWVDELTFPDAIVPINVKTGAVGTPIVLGGQHPQSLSIAPDGRTAYVVDYQPGDPFLVPVDLATRTLGTKIPLGVADTAINPQGTVLYGVGNGLTPVDLATGTVGPEIAPARAGLVQVAVTPDGSTAFATMFRNRSGHAVVFDLVHLRVRASIVVGTEATGVTITPDQAPIAVFHVHRTAPRTPATFDATESQAVSSPIVNYHWSFGDGSTADTTTPTTTHAYDPAGQYVVTLTLTDAAGTSTQRVYSSRYVSRNGSRLARCTHALTIG